MESLERRIENLECITDREGRLLKGPTREQFLKLISNSPENRAKLEALALFMEGLGPGLRDLAKVDYREFEARLTENQKAECRWLCESVTAAIERIENEEALQEARSLEELTNGSNTNDRKP